MTTLLSIGSDAKTKKGEKVKVSTAIQYLRPYTLSGLGNLCAFASDGCAGECLETAGRMNMNPAIMARQNRTELFMKDRKTYTTKLIFEIAQHKRKAEKLSMIPAVRLNGKVHRYMILLGIRLLITLWNYFQMYSSTTTQSIHTQNVQKNHCLAITT